MSVVLSDTSQKAVKLYMTLAFQSWIEGTNCSSISSWGIKKNQERERMKREREREREHGGEGGSGVELLHGIVINLSSILMGATDTKLNLRARESEG